MDSMYPKTVNGPVEIYAELTNKLLRKIEHEGYVFALPDGVELVRKKGSRCCLFTVDKFDKEFLQELLDQMGMTWQEQ